MIKAIVVAANFSQYATYIRNRQLKREEYGYFVWNSPEKCYGLDKEKVKVLWLEGWSENKSVSSDGMKFLKLFKHQQQVSEGWIYSEGFSV